MQKPKAQRIWYALANDGYLYCLGDCGHSIDKAEQAIEDLNIQAVWITDEPIAEQWRKTLNARRTENV
jgi:hypothetical protein